MQLSGTSETLEGDSKYLYDRLSIPQRQALDLQIRTYKERQSRIAELVTYCTKSRLPSVRGIASSDFRFKLINDFLRVVCELNSHNGELNEANLGEWFIFFNFFNANVKAELKELRDPPAGT